MKIFAKISLHILGRSFCRMYHILEHFLPNVVAVKSVKNYLRRSCSAWAIKILMKFTQGLTSLYESNALAYCKGG